MSIENGATVAKGMRVAMQGHQTGRKVIISKTPKGKIYGGLKLGDIVKIIQPPGKYLNTKMAVWVKGLNGKPVSLPYQYWSALPKDAEVNVPLYIKNHPEKLQTKAYIVPVMPVARKVEKEEQVVVRRKVISQPVVARRK